MAWLEVLLSDRLRLPVAGLALAWLAWMGWGYADFAAGRQEGISACMAAPQRCAGERVVLPIWKVIAIHDERYLLSKVGPSVTVVGSPEGLEVHDTVSVEGRFDAELVRVVEERRYHHALREEKEALGVLAVVGLGIWLPLTLRVGRGGLRYRG